MWSFDYEDVKSMKDSTVTIAISVSLLLFMYMKIFYQKRNIDHTCGLNQL